MKYEESIQKGAYGILGGTFDPIHVGHMEIAHAAHEYLRLEKVFLVPAWKNPLKSESGPTSTADERLAMAYLATLDSQGLYVDTFEIERGRATGEPSYTIETLKYFRARYPDVPLVLLTGSDNVALQKWYSIEEFPDYLESIVVISRPEFSRSEESYMGRLNELKEKFPGVFEIVRYLPIADVDVSATMIREHLKSGDIPSDLLPPGVDRFIEKYRLYGYMGEIIG